LTRGALVHHFPNLSGLSHPRSNRSTTISSVRSATNRPRSRTRSSDVGAVSDPRFKAVIEAWLAVANDGELRREIGPVITRFSKLVDPAGRTQRRRRDPDPALLSHARAETMLGLALGRAVGARPRAFHTQRERARSPARRGGDARTPEPGPAVTNTPQLRTPQVRTPQPRDAWSQIGGWCGAATLGLGERSVPCVCTSTPRSARVKPVLRHCTRALRLDDLGFASELNDGVVPANLEDKARAAAANCPEFAISIMEQS